jgi:peptide-methionine (S)-S-oxide reductase
MSVGSALDVATLGGGCFWCLEAVFQEVEGVEQVVSGYAGGHVPDPTYEQVCGGTTGHAEVVQVHFDPSLVSFADLLRIFFTVHDPTTRDRQGADVGPQYRSVILWQDERQRDDALGVMDEVRESGAWGDALVTELGPLEAFYQAEPHHQDYRRRNPRQPYCRIVIDPKLEKFRRVFARLRRAPGPMLVAGLLVAASLFALPAHAMSQDLISTQAMLAVPPVPADRRIAYGPHPGQFGDLYLPDGPGPHPVAVVVHGGCWRSLASLDYTSHLSRALARDGWAAWNLEFRRIDEPGGAWPGILEDVALGADHLRSIAAEHQLDLERGVVLGHSSGGHLALWLAARAGLEDDPADVRLRGRAPLRLRGVVGLAAITDLDDFHQREGRGCGPTVVADLLGGDPSALPVRLALTSPAERLPLGVAQLLVTGREDRTVPLAHVRAYGARAAGAGETVEVVDVPGAGHFEVVAPWASEFHAVRVALARFLGRVEAIGTMRPTGGN